METVKVSPKFQVVIPRRVRKLMGLRPRQTFQVQLHKDRLEFIPVRRKKEMRGCLRGIDTSVERGRRRA